MKKKSTIVLFSFLFVLFCFLGQKQTLHEELENFLNNDLTDFILKLTIQNAFEELKRYLKRKTEEDNSVALLANIKGINMRQAQIIKIMLKKTNTCFSVKEIENRFSVSNFTARMDLEGLVKLDYLSDIKLNKVKRNYIKSAKFDKLIKG